MAKQKSIYRKLIDDALKQPKHQPRKPEPIKFRKKLTEVLTRPRNARRVAVDAYSILTDALASGQTVIEKKVPVDQLHRHMVMHINRFTAQAIMSGGLPMSIHVVDRFKTILDFGGGRCLTMRVELEMQPETLSLGNFIVEEDRQSEIDFSMFDRIPDIPYTEADRQKGAKIINASITQQKHIK